MAILFGCLTAILFAGSSLMSSRIVHRINQNSAIAWIMFLGTLWSIPFLIHSGIPQGLSFKDVAILAWAGIGNVLGLIISFQALRVGKVGLVAPIVSTEGALAAVMSSLFGESLKPAVIFTLIIIVIGVVLAGLAKDPEPLEHEEPVKAVLLATLSAFFFGSTLFATGYSSDSVSTIWLSFPPRAAGVVMIFLPLLLSRKLKMNRKALPFIIGVSFTEVIGFFSFALGSSYSIAIASVTASQFAVLSAIGGYLLFKEKLGKLQILGVTIVIIGVLSLTLASR